MASTDGEELERKVHFSLQNNTSTEVTFEWYLSFTKDPSPGSFPDIILAGETVTMDNVQVKGAIMYSGYNKENDHCAWLVAWLGTQHLRRVYAACGLKSVIARLTPEEIEQNLDVGFRSASVHDPTTMTNLFTNVIGSWPNDSSAVYANFGLDEPNPPTSITTTPQ